MQGKFLAGSLTPVQEGSELKERICDDILHVELPGMGFWALLVSSLLVALRRNPGSWRGGAEELLAEQREFASIVADAGVDFRARHRSRQSGALMRGPSAALCCGVQRSAMACEG
jgi:hypothetical protein